MGGQGSGRWARWARKKTVDDYKTIDIRQWAKNSGLENQKFKAGWKSGGNITGTIDVQTSRDWVQLDYRQNIGGRWHTRQQRITLLYMYFGVFRGVFRDIHSLIPVVGPNKKSRLEQRCLLLGLILC